MSLKKILVWRNRPMWIHHGLRQFKDTTETNIKHQIEMLFLSRSSLSLSLSFSHMHPPTRMLSLNRFPGLCRSWVGGPRFPSHTSIALVVLWTCFNSCWRCVITGSILQAENKVLAMRLTPSACWASELNLVFNDCRLSFCFTFSST